MKETKALIEHLFTQQGLPIPQSEEDIYQPKLVPHLICILADLCEASGVYQKEDKPLE
jgi:hypothetical protein